MLAIVATVQFKSGADLDQFLSNTGNCLAEPWRLLAPALFHEGMIHLLFNLYWLWFFGTKIEDEFGHVATLGIYSAFGRRLDGGRNGHLSRRHRTVGRRLRAVRACSGCSVEPTRDSAISIDHSVVELMFGWLLVCIVLTMAERMACRQRGPLCRLRAGSLVGLDDRCSWLFRGCGTGS